MSRSKIRPVYRRPRPHGARCTSATSTRSETNWRPTSQLDPGQGMPRPTWHGSDQRLRGQPGLRIRHATTRLRKARDKTDRRGARRDPPGHGSRWRPYQADGPRTRPATTHLGTAMDSDDEDTTDVVAMMRTAPWRNTQPGRSQARQGRPPPLNTPGVVLTESSRSLGTLEGEHAAADHAPGHEELQPEDTEMQANRAQLRSLDPLCLRAPREAHVRGI